MADKSFGVKELNLLNASGTPTVTSPNNLNLNANTVAISTSATVGNNLTVTSTTNSANLNVTGIGTLTRGFATDLSVSGISTISQPSNANPHSLWDVVNNGSSAYRFTGPGQSGDENNPNIYLVRGQRYIFKVNASGHPFQLRVANGGAAYSDGVTNNGAQSGNVVINVQHDAPAQLYYQCTNHGGMVGNIYIVGGPQVISGVVTATSFVGSGANITGVLKNIVEDTSPQLGGNLDNNGKNITFGDSAGSSDDRLTFGAGTDLSIYHDNSNSRSRIEHSTDNALEILQGGNAGMLIQNQNSYNIEIKTNAEDAIKCVANGAVELYHNNVKKFETLTNGVQITGSEFISEGTILLEKSGAHHHRILSNDSGNDLAFQQSSDTGANTNFTTYLRINDGGNISLPVDNQRLRLGASADLELFHNGSHSYIQDNGTGALYIGSNGGGVYVRGQHGEESIIANSNGAVELYHDNVKKMETTSVGVTMNDTVITNGEIRPASDNNHSIGRSNRRYITYFGVNGSINTSDRNEKNTIVDSDLGLDFINKLNPVSYKWNKDDGKTHYGLIVQDLEETLTSIGKTVSDFGGIYKEPNSPMGLGYSELISPLIKAVQELSVENAALKARLDAAGL